MRKKVKVARYTVKLLIRPHSDLKAKEKKQDTDACSSKCTGLRSIHWYKT